MDTDKLELSHSTIGIIFVSPATKEKMERFSKEGFFISLSDLNFKSYNKLKVERKRIPIKIL